MLDLAVRDVKLLDRLGDNHKHDVEDIAMDGSRHPVPGMDDPAQGRGARVSTAVVARTRTRTLPLPLPLPRTRTRAVTRARGRAEAVTLILTLTRTLTCQHSCARQVESHVNQARVVLLVG